MRDVNSRSPPGPSATLRRNSKLELTHRKILKKKKKSKNNNYPKRKGYEVSNKNLSFISETHVKMSMKKKCIRK